MIRHLEDVILPTDTVKPDAENAVRIESSPRWVRAYFGGVAVADSKRVLLVWEPRRFAIYWFPTSDVRMDLLTAAGGSAATQRWTLRVGDRVAESAAWSYPEQGPQLARLEGHIAFYWKQMDAWYEEDDEVFVHARDPYHRVDVLDSSRQVRVEVDGQVIAESSRPRLLFETGLPTRYYLHKQDVRMDLMVPTTTTSQCPYKGVASYWSLRSGETLMPDIAWAYPLTIAECPRIENLVSFFNERVDLFVDGELQPRPKTPWSSPPATTGRTGTTEAH
jgi:uncharacterized protein (DUF427 family)